MEHLVHQSGWDMVQDHLGRGYRMLRIGQDTVVCTTKIQLTYAMVVVYAISVTIELRFIPPILEGSAFFVFFPGCCAYFAGATLRVIKVFAQSLLNIVVVTLSKSVDGHFSSSNKVP